MAGREAGYAATAAPAAHPAAGSLDRLTNRPEHLDGGTAAGTTGWSDRRTPFREFFHTESGGAAILLAASLAALVWANVSEHSYHDFWSTVLSVELGDHGISLDLHHWVNSGLMAFFFFVVGLEARREFDLGELRERRRVLLPALAAVGGMAVAAGIYLAFNAGTPAAHGWGVAMSTDTAFALGLLAVVGPSFPERLRAFLLTVVVVDDVVALAVIATVYTTDLDTQSLALAAALFGLVVAARALGVRRGLVYFVLGLAVWVALLESGVEPAIAGLAMGLLAYAYPARRGALESATSRFREFREQPTAELARSVGAEIRSALSPNDRLQLIWHPWTSYVIVPLFALANAGIAIDGELLRRSLTSPLTVGIVVACVAGKPIGIVAGTLLQTRLGNVRAPIGWGGLVGGGTLAGIGFTVALLVASLAFEGEALEEAKIGILAAALVAAAAAWLFFRGLGLLPKQRRLEALLGTAEPLTDLAVEVDPAHDHVRGPANAPVTVVEYADFECPFCGRAETVVRELLEGFTGVRYVWRHLPLTEVHPHAQLAAEAAEAAGAQGRFWEMHDLLLSNQERLRPADLLRYARELGLDLHRFADDLRGREWAGRVAEDVDSAELSGVTGTPTFFVNGRRHYGAYDIEALSEAVRTASARAALTSLGSGDPHTDHASEEAR